MDYDNYLMTSVERFYRGCTPSLDGDGDPINCLECDNKDCEFWHEYHEMEEK